MGTHPATQTAVVFHEAEESVTAKYGRPVGTFLMLTSFPKLDTQGAKRETVNPSVLSLWKVEIPRHTTLGSHSLFSSCRKTSASGGPSAHGLDTRAPCVLRVLSPHYILPIFPFHFSVCKIPLEGTGAYAWA